MNTHDADSVYSHPGTDADHGTPGVGPAMQNHVNSDMPEFVDGGPDGPPDAAANYIDWASQFLLDGGSSDLLDGFDFGAAAPPSSNIMHKIQYQNSVHEQPGKDGGVQYDHPSLHQGVQLPPLPPTAAMTPNVGSVGGNLGGNVGGVSSMGGMGQHAQGHGRASMNAMNPQSMAAMHAGPGRVPPHMLSQMDPGFQNPQNPQNPRGLPYLQNVQNVQNLQNLQNLQNQQNMQNMHAQNAQNLHAHAQNLQTIQNAQNAQKQQMQLNLHSLQNLPYPNALNLPYLPYLQNPPVQPNPQAQMPAKGAPAKDHRTKPRRPCDNCRRKKIRCVIIPNTENCAQCETRSLTCTYSAVGKDEPAPKRVRNAAGADANVNDGTGAKRPKNGELPGQMAPGTHPISGPGYYDNIVPPNVPIRTVAPVQDYSTMNNSLLKKTLSLQFPRSSFYVGPTSYLFDTNLLEAIIQAQNKAPGGQAQARTPALNKIEQVNLSDKISLRKVEHKTQFVLQDDQTQKLIQTMSNDVDAIEKFIAPHGQILIDLYFRIIHPSYPILHKKVFLEKYSRTHREFSAPLLAAVYALAIQWWDYDPQLNRFPKPNVEHIVRIGINNYILEILKRPKLSAVQAGLLLLQCKHILQGMNVAHAPMNSFGMALASLTAAFNDSNYNDWVLCLQVVALLEELGLGLDCDGWKLPKWERGLRKRLAWAVYLEDKWLSLKNSRPSHISDLNWVVLDLAEEDFPEKHGDGDLKEGSSDITNGKKNFMNLISLSKILSEILNSLFSMKAMKEITDINEVLRIAKPIQLKLRTWYHSLPVELQMNSVQPRKLCSNGYLQLAYFAAELTLHRKIITTLYQQNQHGSKIPEDLLHVCRSAARTRLIASIEFVKELKPEHIHSFWHSSASCNFTLIGTFAALLFISATSKDETKDFKEKVYDYRWVLKISAKGFVQVGDSLQKLDLVMNHIPGLLNESSEQPSMTPNVPTIDYNKPYLQPPPLQLHPLFKQDAYLQQQVPKHVQMQNHLPHLQHLQHLQHLPRLPALHAIQHLPLLLRAKPAPQQPQQSQQYPKPPTANEHRPVVQRHGSSGPAKPAYPGNYLAGNTNIASASTAASNQPFRHPNQTHYLPFDAAQAMQGQGFHPQQGAPGGAGSLRNTPISTHSPQSVLGRSPKETATRPQQRASYAKASQSDTGSNHSTPAQGPEPQPQPQPQTEGESSKTSPVLVRSPLSQLVSAKVDDSGETPV